MSGNDKAVAPPTRLKRTILCKNMDLIINEDEMLILDYALEYIVHIPALSDQKLDLLFNMPKHSLPLDELPLHVIQLLDHGFIEITVNDRVAPYNLISIKQWLVSRRRDYKSVDEIACYRLTEKGGALLESYLNINWEYFVNFVPIEFEHSSELFNIEAGSEIAISTVINNMSKDTVMDGFVIKGSINVTHPWYPVYWKRLDRGYTLQIQADRNPGLDSKWCEGLPAWRDPPPCR